MCEHNSRDHSSFKVNQHTQRQITKRNKPVLTFTLLLTKHVNINKHTWHTVPQQFTTRSFAPSRSTILAPHSFPFHDPRSTLHNTKQVPNTTSTEKNTCTLSFIHNTYISLYLCIYHTYSYIHITLQPTNYLPQNIYHNNPNISDMRLTFSSNTSNK